MTEVSLSFFHSVFGLISWLMFVFWRIGGSYCYYFDYAHFERGGSHAVWAPFKESIFVYGLSLKV